LRARRDRGLQPPLPQLFLDKRQRERNRKNAQAGYQQFRIEIHYAPTRRALRPILGYRRDPILQPS
jgi:hypothetical protein